MIQSFSDDETEHLFRSESTRRFSAVARVALRKLIQLNNAHDLRDLAIPPGNRLEALKGRWSGFHSIPHRPMADRVSMAKRRAV